MFNFFRPLELYLHFSPLNQAIFTNSSMPFEKKLTQRIDSYSTDEAGEEEAPVPERVLNVCKVLSLILKVWL